MFANTTKKFVAAVVLAGCIMTTTPSVAAQAAELELNKPSRWVCSLLPFIC